VKSQGTRGEINGQIGPVIRAGLGETRGAQNFKVFAAI
jgi:hypothetical protein